MMTFFLCAVFGAFAIFTYAGFPPPTEGVITIPVPGQPGTSISYKETTICETEAKGYAGYVHLPASALNDIGSAEPYNISTFFWYFEAREDPQNAQTAIYLAGGPGQSSMYGVTESGGPCTIHPDSNSTQHNPYSFNEHVNMLYIDQPVGTGFSYDSLLNSTQNLIAGAGLGNPDTGIAPFDSYDEPIPAENTTFLYGTFPSQDYTRTSSTSQTAAKILWRFSQAWFSTFPEYKTSDKRVSLWGNSYGGYFVPATASYIVEQNQRIKSGELRDAYNIDVDTIGWTNGCSDVLVQGEWFPEMAYNNTYDFQAVNSSVYEEMKAAWSMPNGCRDQVQQCRALGNELDPEYLGTDQGVNAACLKALYFCFTAVVQGPYSAYSGNRSPFDLAHTNPDPFPYSYLIGFFNREWVQRHLGVPVNFTANSNLVGNSYAATGDFVRYEGLKTISSLLNNGVKVAMIYGDRDYRCPWIGGEQLALQANWTDAQSFQKTGYETIRTSSCYDGGVVRQYGNLSFSRVFDAGHDAAAYQPRTVFEIFNRAMLNRDVATGTRQTNGERNDYASKGPLSSFGIKKRCQIHHQSTVIFPIRH